MKITKNILMPFQTKEGRILAENWKLPESDKWPAKDFTSITFFNLQEAKIDKMNLPTSEYNAITWQFPDGEEAGIDEREKMFYAGVDPDGNYNFPEVEFVFEEKINGRYSTLTLVSIKLLEDEK